jgi:hypothetical protein
MDASIHTVDKERRDSDGHRLTVRAAHLEAVTKRYEGLPLGEPREQLYIEVRAVSWDGSTQSILTAQLNCHDIQRLYEEAQRAGLVMPADAAGKALSAEKQGRKWS